MARFERPITPRLVEVAFVDVVFVKTAAAGVVRPIVVPLMVPPVSVTLLLERFVIVPLVTSAVVANKFVDVVFVPVALVHVMLVGAIVVTVKFVAPRFAAKRFVAVAFVIVELEKKPFHRRAAEPRLNAPSRAGFRFVVTEPDTARFVAVAFVKTAAAADVRPIVVPFIVPPDNVTFPLVRFVMREFVEKKLVDVVFVPVALVHVMFVGLSEPTAKFVNAPSTAKRRLPVAFEKFSVETVEEPAEKFPVSVRLEPVALVNVAVWRPVVPVTVKFEIVAPP
jgi:hypothetical protein